MSPEIVAALVSSVAAVVSGALAGIISWLASRGTIRAEVDKVRLGLRHIQAQPLQTERLRTYPELYRVLSDSVKKVEAQGAEGIDLAAVKAKVDEWDSCHSLLLSVPSTRVIYGFRQHLSSLLHEKNPLVSSEAQIQLIQEIAKAELALKADLAVLGLDLYSPERIWQNYSEIESEYDQQQRHLSRRSA